MSQSISESIAGIIEVVPSVCVFECLSFSALTTMYNLHAFIEASKHCQHYWLIDAARNTLVTLAELFSLARGGAM